MPSTFPNLQPLLDAAGLSQSAAAEAISLRRPTLHGWANGDAVRVDLDSVDRLCKLLTKQLGREITIDELRRKKRG